MKPINILRIFLLVLIIEGVVLLFTQSVWVPKLVNMILVSERRRDPDTAPIASARSLAIFRQLTANDSYATVERLAGKPDRDIGSGLHIFVYDLPDGSQIYIGFADLNKLIYVSHVFKDGRPAEQLAGPQN